MTLQEIQDLAGHRDVPPWVVKLVSDAVAKENEACARLCENAPEPDGYDLADRIRARGQA